MWAKLLSVTLRTGPVINTITIVLWETFEGESFAHFMVLELSVKVFSAKIDSHIHS